MNPLAIVPLGFAPGIFWLWLIYQRDRYLPSPVALVVRTFLWGVAAALPIALVEATLTGFGLLDEEASGTSPLTLAYIAFVVAGGVEELGKYLVVRGTVYTSPYFLEPKDGLIYAAAALGFASLENVFYMLEFGWEIIVVRAVLSTLGHVSFGALWGFALGSQKGSGRQLLTNLALLSGMALHGLFDYLLFTDAVAQALGVFLAGAGLFVLLLRRAIRISAARHTSAAVVLACPRCGMRIGSLARFCPGCGLALTTGGVQAATTCSACGFVLAPQYGYCPSCGGRLDRKALSPWTLGSTMKPPEEEPSP